MPKKTYKEQAFDRKVRLAKEKLKQDKHFDARHELSLAKTNDDLKKGGVRIDAERLTSSVRRKRGAEALGSLGSSPVTASKKKKKKKPSKTYHYEYK